MFIWKHKDWPNFTYDTSRYTSAIDNFYKDAQRTYGRIESMARLQQEDTVVDLMTSEAINTSAIEGEQLNRASVQSSIKAFIGLTDIHRRSYDPKEEGMATLMISVRQNWSQALTQEKICRWQEMVVMESKLFPIERGQYRTHESPMQIVSGAMGRERVHYVAPPSKQVADEMEHFLDWYNKTSPVEENQEIPGLLRAGIAHAWFETIHPFEDGNGRVGRAIMDHALSQMLGYPTLASLSTVIEQNRDRYYEALGNLGDQGMNINHWLDYFIDTAIKAQLITKQKIDFILGKTRFYDRFGDHLNERQEKVIGRIFSAGINGFEGGLTGKKYRAIAKCSPATASRDISKLVEMDALVRQSGGGRNTHYQLSKITSAFPPDWGRETPEASPEKYLSRGNSSNRSE